MTEQQVGLVSASELQRLNILPKGTAYRMARSGQIPCYSVGTEGRGVRFRVDEVLVALRRPMPPKEAEGSTR